MTPPVVSIQQQSRICGPSRLHYIIIIGVPFRMHLFCAFKDLDTPCPQAPPLPRHAHS